LKHVFHCRCHIQKPHSSAKFDDLKTISMFTIFSPQP
jgi:hypothetical protein